MDHHFPAWLKKKLLQRPAYEADIVCNLLRSGGYLRIYFISFFLDSGSFLSSFFINRCFGVAEEEWNKMFFCKNDSKIVFLLKMWKVLFLLSEILDNWNQLSRSEISAKKRKLTLRNIVRYSNWCNFTQSWQKYLQTEHKLKLFISRRSI